NLVHAETGRNGRGHKRRRNPGRNVGHAYVQTPLGNHQGPNNRGHNSHGRSANYCARHAVKPGAKSAGHISNELGAPMKNVQTSASRFSPKHAKRNDRGFTMVELMIAMTVFLVIGAAAMSLFKQHASLFNDQQYQIGLNVSLRNALAQMEADIVNAGTGWYNATNNVSSWPIGVTIVNQTAGGAGCHPANTSTYTQT